MNSLNYLLNHLSWELKSLNEHNKIVNINSKTFFNKYNLGINRCFQSYYYNFTMYLKLINNLIKGFSIVTETNNFNPNQLKRLEQIYLLRSVNYLKEANKFLKSVQAQTELNLNPLFNELKQIYQLLNSIDKEIFNIMIESRR